jgi:hypothetical protein
LLAAATAAGPYDSAAAFLLFARSGYCRFLRTGVSAIGGGCSKPMSDLARRKLRRAVCPYGSRDADCGGGGGVDGRVTAASDDGSSDDGGGNGDDDDGDDDGLPVLCKLTRRCGTSTESIKTPLRLRLRAGCCGVGDGLRSPRKATAGARGAVPNIARAVCSRRSAGSGVTGCKRLRWTSSRSASLSSSGAVARLLFGDRASAGVLLARRLPSCREAAPGEASAMRSRSVTGRTRSLGGEFSLSAPFKTFLGERSGDRGRRHGVERDVELVTKSSVVGMMGDNTSPRWTVAVFNGRGGEHVRRAAFGVDGGSTSFVGVRKGLESCDASVVSDASSSSVAARVDEELQENAGPSVGTLRVSLTVSTGSASDLSTTFTSLPQALRQVVTGEGHPSSGTGLLP